MIKSAALFVVWRGFTGKEAAPRAWCGMFQHSIWHLIFMHSRTDGTDTAAWWSHSVTQPNGTRWWMVGAGAPNEEALPVLCCPIPSDRSSSLSLAFFPAIFPKDLHNNALLQLCASLYLGWWVCPNYMFLLSWSSRRPPPDAIGKKQPERMTEKALIITLTDNKGAVIIQEICVWCSGLPFPVVVCSRFFVVVCERPLPLFVAFPGMLVSRDCTWFAAACLDVFRTDVACLVLVFLGWR